MRTILIGRGHPASRWLDALKSHRQATTVAVVDDDGTKQDTGANVPVVSSLHSALDNCKADVAIVSGDNVAKTASDALVAGLSVIVTDPVNIAYNEFPDLVSAALRSNGQVITPRTMRYEGCSKLVQGFLSTDRLGAIGHVSCVDYRRSNSGGSNVLGNLAQFSQFGSRHLDAVCRLFGTEAKSIIARFDDRSKNGANTEAYLELNSGVHVQYFGSINSAASEHVLWIEGAKGSLRTDGKSVWWRKRGWRFFAPIRYGLLPTKRSEAAVLDRVAAQIKGQRSVGQENDLNTIGLVLAAKESSTRQRPVMLSELDPTMVVS